MAGRDEVHVLKQQVFGIRKGSGAHLVKHRQIDPANCQPFGDMAAESFQHAHLDAGEIRPYLRQQGCKQHQPDRGRHAQSHDTLHRGPAGGQVMADLRHIGQNAAGAGQQGLTQFGHHHAASVAVEQGHAQVELQLPDAAAKGGLRDVVRHRGFGKAARLCDRNEILKVAQIHGPGPDAENTAAAGQARRRVAQRGGPDAPTVKRPWWRAAWQSQADQAPTDSRWLPA